MTSTNQEIAQSILDRLHQEQIRTICLCPGARNSPFISLLSRTTQFETLSFFDERSAGFFALSRSRQTDKPVAVVTTSGTAVGELLPAVMEAYYSGAQLVVISADRPQRFRGTGAPQACEQKGIFGVYAKAQLDVDRTFFLQPNSFELCSDGPTHWNVCFEEPLPSDEANRSQGVGSVVAKKLDDPQLQTMIAKSQAPLVLLGELTVEESERLKPYLLSWKVPVIAETLSHLSGCEELETLRIRPHSLLWKESLEAGYKIDFVLRFGGVPTLRFWRDLEVHPEASQIAVASVGPLEFSGLPRARHLKTVLSAWLERQKVQFSNSNFAAWKDKQRESARRLESSLRDNPKSEPSWFQLFSKHIAPGAEIYLGNSLPIREWDLAATSVGKNFSFRANRGLNGIDGQLSSFFGGLKADRENWCILGDLTTLYDSTAPWILSQLPSSVDWRLIIVNNGGGQIFKRMFCSELYLNSHAYHFEHWAKQWGLRYGRIESPEDFVSAATAAGPQVLEVIPSSKQTEMFWKSWEPSK
jgi:2-succinyl-5-enolpyruvyl-6-hydroxy-3-cyclohexene-1-carboxylate synthase